MPSFSPRPLPESLASLTDLALDLRWTWSHGTDKLWQVLDQEAWQRTRNPWTLLQNISHQRLTELANDEQFCQELQRLVKERETYHTTKGWYDENRAGSDIARIAYFSMEFGLGEALPIYAGGLGILAGDYLKTSSDLGLPVVGVGLLYQQGYFRQMIDNDGRQLAIYPYNEPSTLPIQPLLNDSGEWMHVLLHLPGRALKLRIWRVNVGRVPLFLLDSNDPLNSPRDRGITNKLYDSNPEIRFLQEMVLGIGGWRLLELIGDDISVCHLNEGHAAFVVLERARQYMEQHQCEFDQALWTTRAGNVFTTHTPVEAGFDTFPPRFIDKYFPLFHHFLLRTGMSLQQLLALGRKNGNDGQEPFNMAYLAMRGCARSNGVSRLHGKVSRQLFSALFPRWPVAEVPVSHVTNGVHVPSWDSAWADQLWTESCGKQRWLGNTGLLHDAIGSIDDLTLWQLRSNERIDLIHYVRKRLALQWGQAGASPGKVASAEQVLDPNVLTLGFARRFATYKRPNLLLKDKARLKRLLMDQNKPVQLVIAGKAHPDDKEGQAMIQEWIQFVKHVDVQGRVVFLEDYDIALAQHLVQGIDVWINTPRRPWEASGTSGMKVLANGGLNLSELDGWWAEACGCNVGWSIGDGKEHDSSPQWDMIETEQLYQRLESDIVPLFYSRDVNGLPRQWLDMIRSSMMKLAPEFSSNRMVREYIGNLYQPAAVDYNKRSNNNGRLGGQLYRWASSLELYWDQIHFGDLELIKTDNGWRFIVPVYLGEVDPGNIKVEIYCEGDHAQPASITQCRRMNEIAGAINGYLYQADITSGRPGKDFTARIVPCHHDARIPAELNLIVWQR